MNFDEIRPYHDEELPGVYEELLADAEFREMLKNVFPQVPFEAIAHKMRACKTKLEFQKEFCYVILKRVARDSTAGVSLDHSAVADKRKAYTYISNHRDITLDSGFLSVELVDQDMDTVEIAIGDNLLIRPWIKKFVRINKSFIVQRALSMRQMLESSDRMSHYIHHTIRDKNQSVWIAQREGRAKDSDDRTQESLLKMLAMGGEGDLIDRLMELNIVPLAISYEYDPCDYLKAREYQLKRDVPDYRKTQADDMMNMRTGILGYKGRVHFQVAPCINGLLAEMDRSLPKQELMARVAAFIDRGIHANYRFYPSNYVAYDCLTGGDTCAAHYSPAEKEAFLDYVGKQLERIDLPCKDMPFLREKLLQMYANPLKNHLDLNRSVPAT